MQNVFLSKKKVRVRIYSYYYLYILISINRISIYKSNYIEIELLFVDA